ncbi:lipopolysaccharide heptosyltransferase II [Leptolyngbya sp. DQ-M1]|uniref:lipopolysaccharide heptosyltransferase II n=1 Tax=Leptolyngbya sp. DQ-M1 TaxID=2933920 RepID=UPI003296AC13
MSWNQAKNLLCIRLDTIGDVLMTTPAFRALKTALPDRRLTLLTSSAGAAIAPLIPEIDQTIVYDSPWLKATAPRESPRPEYDMIDLLRQHQFDGAIIFTVYSQNPLPSAFLCYLAEIPLRLAHCHENPYQLLTDWIKDPEPDRGIRHEVQRQLDLVTEIGATAENQHLSLRVDPRAHDRVSHLLSSFNLPKRWVVMHTGATAPSRRYSIEQFAIVADQLILEHDFAVIFTGTAIELDIVAQIRAKMQATAHSLVCQLSLGEFAALIELAPVVISNNTAPAHLAAALGTPVVDLYALTNPQHTPWQVPHRLLFQDVPCKYCYKSICPEGHHNCLAQVAPETVVKATCELLEEVTQMLEVSA